MDKFPMLLSNAKYSIKVANKWLVGRFKYFNQYTNRGDNGLETIKFISILLVDGLRQDISIRGIQEIKDCKGKTLYLKDKTIKTVRPFDTTTYTNTSNKGCSSLEEASGDHRPILVNKGRKLVYCCGVEQYNDGNCIDCLRDLREIS